MSDTFTRIRRAVMAGRLQFTLKAQEEIDRDGLSQSDVVEALLFATGIYKTINSQSADRSRRREKLHIILGMSLGGQAIYTKGKIVSHAGEDHYYVLISSKRNSP